MAGDVVMGGNGSGIPRTMRATVVVHVTPPDGEEFDSLPMTRAESDRFIGVMEGLRCKCEVRS